MKKIVLSLAVLASVALVSCNKGEKATDSVCDTTATEVVAENAEAAGDTTAEKVEAAAEDATAAAEKAEAAADTTKAAAEKVEEAAK